jgi:CelD/BcsL family acetyltransferase involved in cellulose biosynthesis
LEKPEKKGAAMTEKTNPPTAKQLRYLRNLAEARGESFTYPQSAAQASAEIERLKSRRRDTTVERRLERLGFSREIAEIGDAARVRDSEISGYGSSAHWR